MTEGAAGKDLTLWLRRMSAGEEQAAEYVASAVYKELRRLAAFTLAGENRQHSLQPSILVNEAFMKLLNSRPVEWQDRRHFFNLASRLMRRIVIDYFRAQGAQKRPTNGLQLSDVDNFVFNNERRDEALMVDEALEKLKDIDERAAKVVELRYFAGLTLDETAEILDINSRTVKRDWAIAQWWLKQYFEDRPGRVQNN